MSDRTDTTDITETDVTDVTGQMPPAGGMREPRPGAGDETSAHARHHGHVVGPVEYRAGDGPSAGIPEGPITVDLTDTDATLSWEAEDTRETAAIPTAEFRRYLSQGAIRLDD